MSAISNTVLIPADDPRRNLVVANPDNSNAQHLGVVWMGMPHGFVTNIGGLSAATQALKASGAFLTERLESRAR